MKMSQQTQGIVLPLLLRWFSHRECFPKVKCYSHSEKLFWHTGTVLWHSALLVCQSHSALSCSYYCDV